MINWQYYPKSDRIPKNLLGIIEIFNKHKDEINSSKHTLPSNSVLSVLEDSLSEKNFQVEKSKKEKDRIKVPVLFGMNGKPERSFKADAYDNSTGTVIEVEAGRAVTNYQFLKDLFEASVMHDVNYLVIAVRRKYIKNQDFQTVVSFFDTLFASQRLKLPLKGILIIGY